MASMSPAATSPKDLTLIFDNGGVFLELAYGAADPRLNALSKPAEAPSVEDVAAHHGLNAEEIADLRTAMGLGEGGSLSAGKQDRMFDRAEVGGIRPELLRAYLRLKHSIPLAVDDTAINTAFSAILLEFYEPRIRLVQQLRAEGYRTFLLSNTNEVHWEIVKDILARQGLTELFESAFEAQALSYAIHARKPDAAAFTYFSENYGVDLSKALFVDDSKMYCEGGVAAGLHVQRVDIENKSPVYFEATVRAAIAQAEAAMRAGVQYVDLTVDGTPVGTPIAPSVAGERVRAFPAEGVDAGVVAVKAAVAAVGSAPGASPAHTSGVVTMAMLRGDGLAVTTGMAVKADGGSEALTMVGGSGSAGTSLGDGSGGELHKMHVTPGPRVGGGAHAPHHLAVATLSAGALSVGAPGASPAGAPKKLGEEGVAPAPGDV